MFTLSRILLLRCNNISRSKGILEECVTNKKSIHFIQRLNACTAVETGVNPLVKHSFNYEDSKPKNYDYSQSFKQMLGLIKKSDKDIHKCLPALNRMIYIYHNERPDHKLSFDLKIFLMSKEFEWFCEILHKHLPNFQPDVLVRLLSMEHFGVPVNSTLMQKVLVLILDNINFYTAFDKVFIYATISREYFKNSEQCADLKKALQVYLETMFDQELDRCKCSVHVTFLMQNPNVPIKVKKKIADKLICDMISTRRGHYVLQNYLEAIFIQSVPLFSPDESIDILRKAITNKPAGMLMKILTTYKKLIQMDHSFYNESFCNELACSDSVLLNKDIHRIANEFCLMGHLNDDLLKSVAERSSVLDFIKLDMPKVLPVASAFARSCIHERNILQPETWEGLKIELQSLHFKMHQISYLHLYLCESLTFLGCDTRVLFNVIFDAIERDNFQKSSGGKYCILRFHHLAKEYFSNDCATLSDETLSKVLEKSASKNRSFPATLIDFIGGEDYLLKNCTTPDKHFLHPLSSATVFSAVRFVELLQNPTDQNIGFIPDDLVSVFPLFINSYLADYVAVLGPDNKPINLSSFKQKTRPASSSENYLYNIEEIERPSGSKIIAFQNFLDKQPIKFYNAPVMSGVAKIFLKSFESLNCDVVLLTRTANSESLRSQLDEIIRKHEEKE